MPYCNRCPAAITRYILACAASTKEFEIRPFQNFLHRASHLVQCFAISASDVCWQPNGTAYLILATAQSIRSLCDSTCTCGQEYHLALSFAVFEVIRRLL